MKLSNIGLALGIAAATIGLTAHAGDHRKASKEHRNTAVGMQVSPLRPRRATGSRWQYFSDPRRARAVVISPKGDDYYSRGHGLRLVYKSEPTA